MELIQHIKEIKVNVKSNKYVSKKILEKDLYEISTSIWRNIKDAAEDNMSVVKEVHTFLIEEVCKIHQAEEDTDNKNIYKDSLNIKNLSGTLNDGKRALNIYSFTSNDYEYYFIGDLHSDITSLKAILNRCDFFNAIVTNKKIRLIFLGDYVDRGKKHLQTLELILLLKYFFSDKIFLLRGNHDGGTIEEEPKLCVGKQADVDYFLLYAYNITQKNTSFSLDVVYKYLDFFNSLCTIAIVTLKEINVFGVHGGIPRPSIGSNCVGHYTYIKSISDLTNEKIKDHIDKTIVNNMLWSDPRDQVDEKYFNKGRFKFNKNHFNNFMTMLGMDFLIRGHEAVENGFQKYFDGNLFTIFSSGIILNDKNRNINTTTAYTDVNPKILKLTTDEGFKILNIY